MNIAIRYDIGVEVRIDWDSVTLFIFFNPLLSFPTDPGDMAIFEVRQSDRQWRNKSCKRN